MMRAIITGALLFVSTAAFCQEHYFREESPEFKRGWCAAVKVIIQNRDHYRAMVHYPAETVDESMKRIYEKWPPRPPAGFVMDTMIAEALNLEMAGIDLYVILPPAVCEEKE
jgi:hypothetical protein